MKHLAQISLIEMLYLACFCKGWYSYGKSGVFRAIVVLGRLEPNIEGGVLREESDGVNRNRIEILPTEMLPW
jgi:hypothetical protein